MDTNLHNYYYQLLQLRLNFSLSFSTSSFMSHNCLVAGFVLRRLWLLAAVLNIVELLVFHLMIRIRHHSLTRPQFGSCVMLCRVRCLMSFHVSMIDRRLFKIRRQNYLRFYSDVCFDQVNSCISSLQQYHRDHSQFLHFRCLSHG